MLIRVWKKIRVRGDRPPSPLPHFDPGRVYLLHSAPHPAAVGSGLP